MWHCVKFFTLLWISHMACSDWELEVPLYCRPIAVTLIHSNIIYEIAVIFEFAVAVIFEFKEHFVVFSSPPALGRFWDVWSRKPLKRKHFIQKQFLPDAFIPSVLSGRKKTRHPPPPHGANVDRIFFESKLLPLESRSTKRVYGGNIFTQSL